MIGRIAQTQAQQFNKKLPVLENALSKRWNCQVVLETMAPRQDFMLCTVPSDSPAEKEILDTALIRLLEGNATYVVQHFGPLGKMRDLDISIKGAGPGATIDGTFSMIRKQLIDYERKGVQLGWRAIGVRRIPQSVRFRGTFL